MFHPIASCLKTEFACSDGKRCIIEELRCNYDADCQDNSDELEGCICDLTTDFLCNSGGCINKNWVCDGKIDCFTDDSDEDSDLCMAQTESPPSTLGRLL